MSEQSERNVAVVQQAYAAFGRGDVEGILDCCAEHINWEPVIGAAPHVPIAGKRQGKKSVREFFRILDETEDIQTFEPREFIAQGDRVVCLGYYAGKTKTTGRPMAMDFVMVFRVENGKVTDFREFTDTAALNAAHEPRAAAAR